MTVNLYSWGANSYGQLGLGNQDDHLLPQKVVLPETLDGTILNQPVANRIKSITGGGGHSIIIQDDGSLFTCGNNCNGQLGLNHYNNIAAFTRVNLPAVILQASAGWDFTVVLSDRGEVFAFGSNEFGQLGFHPKELQKSTVPVGKGDFAGCEWKYSGHSYRSPSYGSPNSRREDLLLGNEKKNQG